MEDWYKHIEEPLRQLVYLLRNNGFNTTCSCAHSPEPYIELDWHSKQDIERLHDVLTENKYKNFEICAYWLCNDQNRRFLKLIFSIPRKLIEISEIKD